MFLPLVFFKISLRDTSFYISLNSLGFYLSWVQNACWVFSDLYSYIFQHVCRAIYSNMLGKKLSIYGVHIPWKSLNLCFFTHAPFPHPKLLVEFLKICFPQDRKGERKLWFALSKFNQKIWRCFGTLAYFHLVWLQFF